MISIFLVRIVNNKKKLEEYISVAKGDIVVYIIVTFVIFGVLLYIGYKVNWYYILLFDLIMIGRIVERVDAYFVLKKIKKHLINFNLIDKIGEIDFWNEHYYMLTENYFIICKKGRIYSFKYSEIRKVYRKSKTTLSKYSDLSEYLYIKTKDNEFKVLIWTNMLVGEELLDITNYLINKSSLLKANSVDK